MINKLFYNYNKMNEMQKIQMIKNNRKINLRRTRRLTPLILIVRIMKGAMKTLKIKECKMKKKKMVHLLLKITFQMIVKYRQSELNVTLM
jgi:hypothetical protein